MRVTLIGTAVALAVLASASYGGAVDIQSPPTPELVAPADGAGGQHTAVTFSWKPVSNDLAGIDHYELWVDNGKDAVVSPTDCTDTCSSQLQGLRESSHSWHVVAVDKAGSATPSATRTFTVAVPPVAALIATPARVLIGRPVTLDASTSTDEGSGITHYEFDTDGDGMFGADAGTDSKITKTYYTPGTIRVSVRVTDDSGLSNTASVIVVVTDVPREGSPGILINDGAKYTNNPKVTISAIWPRYASNLYLSNDSAFRVRTGFPVAGKTPWTLDASGPDGSPRTVYARYLGGTQISELFSDEIILDQIPPSVSAAQLHTSAKSITLGVKAKDTSSGVDKMQVTTNRHSPGKLLAYKTKITVKPARALYVRVRDRAGNYSPWRAAKHG